MVSTSRLFNLYSCNADWDVLEKHYRNFTATSLLCIWIQGICSQAKIKVALIGMQCFTIVHYCSALLTSVRSGLLLQFHTKTAFTSVKGPYQSLYYHLAFTFDFKIRKDYIENMQYLQFFLTFVTTNILWKVYDLYWVSSQSLSALYSIQEKMELGWSQNPKMPLMHAVALLKLWHPFIGRNKFCNNGCKINDWVHSMRKLHILDDLKVHKSSTEETDVSVKQKTKGNS